MHLPENQKTHHALAAGGSFGDSEICRIPPYEHARTLLHGQQHKPRAEVNNRAIAILFRLRASGGLRVFVD